jgi:hypothetical protein
MGTLTSGTVQDIVKQVLFKADELVDGNEPVGAIKVDGLVNNFAFHPERIAQAKPQIDALLAELPDNFHRNKGGGWTFLNACQDRDGEQWTGFHQAMEQLVCLGIAVGSASWMMREMADILPGGVPYFEVHPETASAAAK